MERVAARQPDDTPQPINAYLHGTNLEGADLSGANLNGADLTGAPLSDANLSFANLGGTNLTEAKLLETTFLDVDLSSIIGLEHRRSLIFFASAAHAIPPVFLFAVALPKE